MFLVSSIISRLWTVKAAQNFLCACCQDILQNPQCTKAAVFTPDKAKGRHSCIEAYARNKFFFWASHWVKWNYDKMLGMFIPQKCAFLLIWPEHHEPFHQVQVQFMRPSHLQTEKPPFQTDRRDHPLLNAGLHWNHLCNVVLARTDLQSVPSKASNCTALIVIIQKTTDCYYI